MQIQSTSLDVPGGCPNNCKFCVSEIHGVGKVLNNVFMKGDMSHCTWLEREFRERLEYLRDIGISNLVLTGTASEPHLNEVYLKFFKQINSSLPSKFKNIELHTSGIKLDGEKLALLSSIGVKTIALSISSFWSDRNAEINGTPTGLEVDIPETCSKIRENKFNLRLNLNMNHIGFVSSIFPSPEKPSKESYGAILLKEARESFSDLLGQMELLIPDQITFRHLYYTQEDNAQNEWVKTNGMSDLWFEQLRLYLQEVANPIHALSFGAIKYSLNGISIAVDSDCMNKQDGQLRYIILRRNCKLYSEWDNLASLIF